MKFLFFVLLILLAGFARADQWTLDKAKIAVAGYAFGKILAGQVWHESMVGDKPFPTAEEQFARESIGANRAGYYEAAAVRLFVAAADQAYETKYAEFIARYNAATAAPTPAPAVATPTQTPGLSSLPQ